MREILFRGKRIDNGEWTLGYYVEAKRRWHKHGIHKEWIVCSAAANGGWFALHEKHAVKGETVGECTVLKDKNGKLIFEGDIIGNPYNVVEYCLGAWTVNGDVPLAYYAKSHEVIGNIHDNPELLEESK